MNNSHDHPVALITGSGRPRIGREIAASLGQSGYRIALHYHRSDSEARAAEREFRERGIDCEAFQADVTKESDVDGLFDQLGERFGRLDALVTTASVWQPKKLEELTAEDVRFNFDVNTLGTFLCVRRGGLMMVGQESGGSIVTFGDWSIQRPYSDHAAYFVAKGAIPTLTRVMAVELAMRNPKVRVNCIHPGPVMEPPGLDADERNARVEATLVKQADDPQTVVHSVRYFIENTFVTGVCLPVDGGRSIYAVASDQ
jgi:pteridine reductase